MGEGDWSQCQGVKKWHTISILLYLKVIPGECEGYPGMLWIEKISGVHLV